MRNLLAFGALLVLTFAGVGVWRGWYTVESRPAASGKIAFGFEVDAAKVADDFKAVLNAAADKAKQADKEPTAP